MSEKTKTCSKCGARKRITSFHKKGDGVRSQCKACVLENCKLYREANKDEKNKRERRYYHRNKEEIEKKKKVYREKNKDKMKAYWKVYHEENKEKIREKAKIYYEKNKERLLEKSRQRYEENKDKRREQCRLWEQNNRDRRNKINRERHRNNEIASVANRARCLIKQAIRRRGYTKEHKAQEILGCDWETLRRHIELQFKDGMSWENRNKWHIDHKIPLSSAQTEEDVIKLCHYTNLQPLWAQDNLSKGAKLLAA